MTKRTIMEVVAIAFGFYCLISLIKSTPSVGMALVMKEPEFITNRLLYALLMSLFPLLNLILAYILLWKTRLIVNFFTSDDTSDDLDFSSKPAELSETQSNFADLSFWIKIIGLYYFVSSVSTVISRLGTLAIKLREGWFWAYDPLLPQAFIFTISLIFIFRSQRVAKFIRRKSIQKT